MKKNANVGFVIAHANIIAVFDPSQQVSICGARPGGTL
jgi:hypothetical protein